MFKFILDATMKRSAIIKCIKRYKSLDYDPRNLPYDCFLKMDKYSKIIKKMGYNIVGTKEILFHNQYLFNVPPSNIDSVYKICKKWKVDLTFVYNDAKVFSMRPEVVECTIMALQEMGVKYINVDMITHYLIRQKELNLHLYKKELRIPQSVNITQKLLEYIGPIPPDAPPLQGLTDDLLVSMYRARFYEWYLGWRLNLSDEDKSKLEREVSKMKHRSIRIIRKLIELLHDDIGFTGKEILESVCLVSSFPENLENILTNVKTFGGIDIKKLIRIKNDMHKMEFNNVVKVKESLEAYGYTDRMMRCCPEILLMPHKKLIENLEIIENAPELRVLKNNTRSLIMVVRMRTVLARLAYFRYHKIRNITVYKLTGHRPKIERIIKIGIDRTDAKEIGFSFQKILKYDTYDIIRKIRKHPHWRHVDIVSMNETANYLLNKFSPEDIYENIQLILYPITVIEKVLTNLPELTEKSDKTKDIPDKQILAICLYEIEKEHHFTGDGIWREYQSLTTGTYVTPEKVEADLADASDSENTETDDTSDPLDDLQINAWLSTLLQKKVQTAR